MTTEAERREVQATIDQAKALKPCPHGKDCGCVHETPKGLCEFRRYGGRAPSNPCPNFKLVEIQPVKDTFIRSPCADRMLYKGCIHMNAKGQCEKIRFNGREPDNPCESFQKRVRSGACLEGVKGLDC